MVNTTFRLAPWADALFAMDRIWWEHYAREVAATFTGERFTSSGECRQFGLRRLPRFSPHGNSGAGAIALASKFGSARAILLGYDMQRAPDGATHWHGSHPRGMGDAGSMPKWPDQFARLARLLRMPVINATRRTALEAFPRARLEDVLGPVARPPVPPVRELEEAEAC